MSYARTNSWIEYNFADPGDPRHRGSRSVHRFSSAYYDSDLTESEVFPHLSEEE